MAKPYRWHVATIPTGQWRQFEHRGWPSASTPSDKPVFMILCEDDYSPNRAREGCHKELVVYVADWSVEEPGFTWRQLKCKFPTLQAAKKGAQEFWDKFPRMHPEVKSKPDEFLVDTKRGE